MSVRAHKVVRICTDYGHTYLGYEGEPLMLVKVSRGRPGEVPMEQWMQRLAKALGLEGA